MRIELAENDGYLYDDGKPRTFIFRVDGKPFPVPAHFSIGEFYSAVTRARSVSGPVQEVREHQEPKVSAIDMLLAEPKQNEIERNDTVTFRPRDMESFTANDNGQVKPGGRYRVLDIRMIDGEVAVYDIIDDNSETPIRTPVSAADCQLFKKSPKLNVVKKARFEMTSTCKFCKDKQGKPTFVALTVEEGQSQYEGKCEDCGRTYTAPYPTPEKVDAQPVTV